MCDYGRFGRRQIANPHSTKWKPHDSHIRFTRFLLLNTPYYYITISYGILTKNFDREEFLLGSSAVSSTNA